MIISNVRVDWVFVFEPGKQGKYGCCVILPKGSTQLEEVERAINKAKAAGIAAGKFTEANTKSTSFKPCLRDGDLECETEDRPKHYLGTMFFNCSSPSQPGIVGFDREPDGKPRVDKNGKPVIAPLMDPDKLYSGCYVKLDVNFYAFSHPKGGKGVGAGLNHIMLVKEGDRLDGRVSAEEAFSGLKVTDDLQ